MAARLRIEGLHLRFGGLTALEGLSLSMAPGEVTGLCGPNGSGKSSLINVITGHYQAEGRILLDDKSVAGLPPYVRVRHGIIRSFQVPRLYRRMTLADNLGAAQQALQPLWPSRTTRRLAQEQRGAVLDLFGLGDKANLLPAEVSAFDLRLLELARAHLSDPALLLLDEPAAGATSAECDRLIRLMADHLMPGRTTILVEHRLDLIRQLCPRMIVLQAGQSLADGPTDTVLSRSAVRSVLIGGMPDAA